jgi:hypothetical protein
MKILGWLFALGLLGVGGWYAYTRWFQPPEKRACSKLATLCGEGGKELASCEQELGKLKQLAGEEGYANATRCIGEAKTCMRAVGCVAGASLSGVGDFLSGMVEGFAPAAKEQGKRLLERVRQTDAQGLKQKGARALQELRQALDDAVK